MNDQELYKRVQQRVKALRGFYVWVGVYVAVSLFLLINNLITDPYNLWFYWQSMASPSLASERTGRSGKSGRSWNRRGSPPP